MLGPWRKFFVKCPGAPEIIGTTRSRVNTVMNKFRQLGIIEYNGEMKVHNSLLNVILHDKPQLRRETGREK
jgi:CRP/FNR family transcriptional regulator, cyclic AMP receptor protein